jgi:hypothetical protein
MKRGNLLFLVSSLALIIFISSCDAEFLHPPWKRNLTTNNSLADLCTVDVKICDDGTLLKRQKPNCEFPSCPIINTNPSNNITPNTNNTVNTNNTLSTNNTCPQDLKNCWDAGNVSRIPPSCEFESCAKYGAPPNTCRYDPDCKIVMSACSCEALPLNDSRDWINGSYCATSECMDGEKLIARAICDDNNVCVKIIQNVTTCFDSDNGMNYNISGIVRVNYKSINISAQDICKDSSWLTEQYCDSLIARSINSTDYNCSSGCLNGACLP